MKPVVSFAGASGRFFEICAHMVWPVSCPVCGAVGTLVCDACLRALLKPPLPCCLLCGKPIPCETHGSGAPKIRAGGVYEGYIREMILMLKYGRHEALAFRLGKALGGVIAPPDLDVLVPVPLHLKSERRYNQAGAIARGLGGAWGIEAWDAARWAMDVAARAGMGRRERLALSTDAFVFDEDLSGLRVGLVDDVSTTGATLFRLAGAARSRGADIAGAFVIALARGAGAPPAGGKKNGENS